MTDIYLNDKYIGEVESVKDFMNKIRQERRSGILPTDLNFEYNEPLDSFYLNITKGRARRPLIVVENGNSKLKKETIEDLKEGRIKWDKLVKEGIIEYLDAPEEESAAQAGRCAVREQPALVCVPAFQQGTCRGASSRNCRGQKHGHESSRPGRLCIGHHRHRRTASICRNSWRAT